MYHLQRNRIIQNTSFPTTNYLLVNHINKKININYNLNVFKSTLATNPNGPSVHLSLYKPIQPTTFNTCLFKENECLGRPTFCFKHNYSQTTNENNVDNEEEKVKDQKETENQNTQDNQNEKTDNGKESKDEFNKANLYSILLGLAAISAAGTLKVHKQVVEKRLEELENETQIKIEGSPLMKFYAMLPLRILSRFVGKVFNLTVPEKCRAKLYRAYAKKFGCNLDEMFDEDLTHYRSISEFFYRKIKPEARPIDGKVDLVSPVDGRVLQFGEIIDNEIEQVKGFTYSVEALLGYDGNSKKEKAFELSKEKVEKILKSMQRQPSHQKMSHQKFLKTYSIDSSQDLEKIRAKEPNKFVRHDHKLYYCVLYLSPGDYHHFHSPANWIIEKRRHFSGHLLSVAPRIVNLVHNLFTVNERIALIGRWKYGFFSMVPVGATNVGSVVLTIDDKLKTNMPYRKQSIKRSSVKYGVFTERSYDHVSPLLQGIPVHRGEELGGFQMGSTVVLVFEAPKNFAFNIQPHQKINMGQPISLK